MSNPIRLLPPVPPVLEYPSSDGKPTADSTLQFDWITNIKLNVDAMFAANPNVFVAGDLFWYPVEGEPWTCTAPDTMVVFGRPKGARGFYMQWHEGGIAPQVVFEVLSPSNTGPEMEQKRQFYRQYGVEEYYQYDPARVIFRAWVRDGDQLAEIPEVNGWVSPRLQIRFVTTGPELRIFRPDGREFRQMLDTVLALEDAEVRAEEAQRERDEALQREEESQRQSEAHRSNAERLAAKLRALGIDPDSLDTEPH